ncbi:MAG: radical SAM protein [candidate division Zixibacteria bacterium]|nr:radical SAM protein [candidate division Zixibacteria bacterium]
MADELKLSKYNHFFKLENGNWLAFNALRCGLAELDQPSYDKIAMFSEGKETPHTPDNDDLRKDFMKGGFLIGSDIEEIDLIKFRHYTARFDGRRLALTIIPTLECNFACDYCYEDARLHSLPPHCGSIMTDEVHDNIIGLCEREISEGSAFSVTWYGGEPLLAPQIVEEMSNHFMKICEAKQSKYFAGMVTNGYLLDQANLELILKARIAFLQITVDGPKEVHNIRRPLKNGGGTYDRIVANLANIPDNAPIMLSIRINIDKRNQESTSLLLEDLKKRGFHEKPNFHLCLGQVIHLSKSCPGIAAQCMMTEEFSTFSANTYKIAMDMGFRITHYPMIMMSNCGAIRRGSVVIEPNGNIQNCWNTVGESELRTGILTPEGIEYNHNYAKWLSWTPFESDCRECNILPICMGGCPYKRLYQKNGAYVCNDFCANWKYNLMSMLKIVKEAKERGLWPQVEKRPLVGDII